MAKTPRLESWELLTEVKFSNKKLIGKCTECGMIPVIKIFLDSDKQIIWEYKCKCRPNESLMTFDIREAFDLWINGRGE